MTRRLRFAFACVAIVVVATVLAGPPEAFAATTYSDFSPAPGSAVTLAKVPISVKVTEPAGIYSSVTLTVDGVKRTARYSASTRLITAEVTGLTNGSHTVYVSVLSYSGVRTNATWTFNVGAPPTLSAPSPTPGAVAASRRPEISALVGVPSGSSVQSVALLIDGVAAPATWNPASSRVVWAQDRDLADDASHSVRFSVTAANGLSAELTSDFQIQVFPDMAETACASCHPTYPLAHDTGGECLTCHNAPDADPSPVGYCIEGCHDWVHGPEKLLPYSCDYCHSKTWTGRIANHSAAPASYHVSATDVMAKGCECHSRALTREHAKHTDSAGLPLTCQTCHGSTDPDVTGAIASGESACDACHSGAVDASHEWLHELARDDECAACHSGGSLTAVHITDGGLGCEACHDSTRPSVVVAIAAGDLECGSCHAAEGIDYHLNMAVHYAPDSYEECGHCHHGWGSSPVIGPDVTRHQSGCTTCHNESTDLEGLSTRCVNCHDEEGVNRHPRSGIVHTPVDEASLDCARCHETTDVRQLHVTDSCQTCHVTYACSECHTPHSGDGLGSLRLGTRCSRCHAVEGADYHDGFEAAHTAGTIGPGCQGSDCHVNELVGAHADFVGADARYPQYDDTCELCHLNENPNRIPDGATADCASCHQVHGDVSQIHTATLGSGYVELFNDHDGMRGSFGVVVACGTCHSASLTAVHGNRCATCHPSPRSSLSSWNGSCQQGGCHASYHADTIDAHWDADAGPYCNVCHDSGWSVPPSSCAGCHATTGGTDTTPPVTTSDALSSYIGAGRITFSISDGGKVGVGTTFYRLDGGPIGSGGSVLVNTPGTHTLQFWSVDQSGNVETPPKQATYTLTADTTPPVTTSNAKTSYIGPASITLSMFEASTLGVKATYYRVNNEAPRSGTSISIPQPAGDPQAYSLTFWSEDWFGNIETPTTVSFTMTRDSTPPVSAMTAQPYYRTSYVSIPFSSTDVGAGVALRYVRLDGGSPYVTPLIATSFGRTLTQGAHSVEYWAVDAVGNSETHKFVYFVVDWTAPTASSDAVDTYPVTGAAITITGSDGPANGSGLANVAYRLDGGPQQNVPSGTTVTETAEGTHSIEYWAIDNAGNVSAAVTKYFTVGTPSQGGNATIRLVWGDADTSGSVPLWASWASWTVRLGGPAGQVVATGARSAPGWSGIDDVVVPINATTPYYVYIDWWDDDAEYEGPTIFPSVNVVAPGSIVILRY